ncbi:MAG: PDC sensor domain-containing protein, partial [Pseudomonadota bacterium]
MASVLVAEAKEELYQIQRKLVNAKQYVISLGELAVMQNLTDENQYAGIQEKLDSIATIHPELLHLLVTDAEGNVVAAADREDIGTNQFSTWQHRVARLRLPYDGPVVTSEGSEPSVAKLSVPVFTTDDEKRLIGVIMVSLNWDTLQRELNDRVVFEGPQSQQRQIILQSRVNDSVIYSSQGAVPPEPLLKVNSDQESFQRIIHNNRQY